MDDGIRRVLAAGFVLVWIGGAACGGSGTSGDDAPGCTTGAECPSGMCIDNRCVPPGADGDADPDDGGGDADADPEVPGADGDADADADSPKIRRNI